MAGFAVAQSTRRHRALVRSLVCLATLGVAGTAVAGDQVAGAVFGAGAGAIIGHSVGGPDGAIVGGIIGAMTGAAVTGAHGPRGVAVQYGRGYGYAPPRVVYAPPPVVYAPPPVVYAPPPVRYYPAPVRGPVYVAPPPAIIFLPGRGHGYWHHHTDAWGRPLQSWVSAPPPRGYYPPGPRGHEPRGRW